MARTSRADAGPVEKSPHAHEAQKAVDEAVEKGYYGEAVDPTPNEAYSLETPDFDQTPEVSDDAYQKAQSRVRADSRRLVAPASASAKKEGE